TRHAGGASPMARRTPNSGARLGDMAAMARLIQGLPNGTASSIAGKRRLVADLCRLVGERVNGSAGGARDDRRVGATANGVPTPRLTPRMEQTLARLLSGDSEKEVATKLRISPNTVHVYVKNLYRKFEV